MMTPVRIRSIAIPPMVAPAMIVVLSAGGASSGGYVSLEVDALQMCDSIIGTRVGMASAGISEGIWARLKVSLS